MPGLLGINFHLIGFSAGGQVALNAASYLWPGYFRQPQEWCGLPAAVFPNPVPSEVDVITIATPLGSSENALVYALSEVAGFFASLWTWAAGQFVPESVFNHSIGEDDYGDPVPGNLCRYIGIVTDSDFDSSWGAEEDPCDDPYRLGDWQPLHMTRADIAGIQLPADADPLTPRHTSAAREARLPGRPGSLPGGSTPIPDPTTTPSATRPRYRPPRPKPGRVRGHKMVSGTGHRGKRASSETARPLELAKGVSLSPTAFPWRTVRAPRSTPPRVSRPRSALRASSHS